MTVHRELVGLQKLCVRVIAAGMFVLLAGCAGRRDVVWTPDASQARLVELTADRLEVAREVAWYKYREGLPVLDRKREKESLKALVSMGREQGIAPSRVAGYFRAQMKASRMLQSYLIAGWQAGSPVPTAKPRSLEGSIRPQIDEYNRGILQELAVSGRQSRGRELAERAATYFRARNMPEEIIETAVRPLR